MNLRALIENTALISAHSPNVIETGRPISLDALQRYWSCARAQRRLWEARLIDFPAEMATANLERRDWLWKRVQSVLADVFAGDLVARVWGAVLVAGDCTAREPCGAPIARSVLAHQAAVRRSALRIIAHGPDLGFDDRAQLDRLRRRLERWTDVLLGHLVRRYGLAEFAFDPDRARDFGDEQLRDSWSAAELQVWDLYLVCLRTSLPEALLPDGRSAELREEIVRTMLYAFPDEAFLESGTMKSVRLRRLLAGPRRSETRPLSQRPRLSRDS